VSTPTPEERAELTQDEIDFVDEIRKASIHPTGLGDFIQYEMSRPDAWEALERILTTRAAAARVEGALELVRAWQMSGWVETLTQPVEPPAVPAIALGQRVTEWLRARAERTTP
jgi:hypothetical protein